MRRLRRLYEEEENTRDRSVPDGHDKYRRFEHWLSTLHYGSISSIKDLKYLKM